MDTNHLFKMSSDELDTYLRVEVERIISQASPKNVLKLRALQASLDGMRKRIKNNPQVLASKVYGMMMDSLCELDKHLQAFRRSSS